MVQEKEAELVRHFFELAAKGESAAAIARIANLADQKTKQHGKEEGKFWTGKTVLQILRNPVYLGKRHYDGKWIRGIHPALVDEGLANTSRKRGDSSPMGQNHYYRCRGNSTGPACLPAVQVAAHIVENEVEWLLANPANGWT